MLAQHTTIETSAGQAVGASYAWHGGQYCAIHTPVGLIGCGIYDIATADRFEMALAIARGTPQHPLRTPEDLLDATLVAVSCRAGQLGISVGMSGRQALNLMLDAAAEWTKNRQGHVSDACGVDAVSADVPNDLPLQNRRVLMFTGEIYEDLELWYPKLRLQEAGAQVTLAGPEAGASYLGKNGYPCVADASIAEVRHDDFDALVVPGGFMPDKLRRDQQVLDLVRGFDAACKPIAAICHGGWIPISAGVYRQVRVTGSPGIKDDLVNAGAVYVDAPVVVDRHHVSSRRPDDLPDFCRQLIHVMVSMK